MPEEEKKEEEFKYEVISRSVMTEYPTLDTERKYVHLLYRYSDLPPLSIDIPYEEYTEEKEKELVKKQVEEELKRLGRI
jgi:hypothetical protein